VRPELWNRIEELFHAASALEGAERAEFLRRECPDPEVRREVSSLLEAGTAAELSLATVVDGAAAEIAETLEPARAGERIGPYRIVRRIGEGGMAVVYLAEQEVPVARRVALKILKIGLDTREVLSRFDAERRLLSRLAHPAIARILDAGATPSGRPYFVLELVDGEPITEFCDARRLRIRERIELIAEVCRAIHHAHQKGIVHRDLKPSNILVAEQDGRPSPKVIDFGIAKVIEQEATLEKLRTQTRHGTLLGTWEYMSPEQAAGSEDLDTRTDIYSLGVILYELLAGEPPFDRGKLRNAGLGELARALARSDPPRPSTRTATAHGVEIAERRGLDPQALRRKLRGDLDRIAVHCLEGDRERRYSSILDVAADLERHLRHEPVTARPPTVRYRLEKFVRRNRPLVLSTVTIAAILVAATFVSLGEARRAHEQERIAERRKEAADHEAYRSRISAATLAIQLGDVQDARGFLDDIAPDRRGFEWRHVASRLDSSAALLAGPERFVAASFGPDGETVITLSPSGRVEHWSWRSGERLSALELGRPVTGAAAFDLAGERVAAVHGGEPRTIALWDARGGDLIAEFDTEIPEGAELAIHPDGDSLVYGGNQVFLVRPGGGAPLPIHGGPTEGLAYSRDGTRLANIYNGPVEGFGEGWLLDCDARSGAYRRGAKRPAATYAHCVAVDPSGSRIALGMEDRSIWIQESESGLFPLQIRGHSRWIQALDWSPDGRVLASAAADATVRLWEPRSGARIGILVGAARRVEAIEFSPGGDRLLARGEGRVWIWELADASPTSVLRGHSSFVYGVAFVGAGARVVSGGWDDALRVWSRDTGELLGSLPAGDRVRGVRASRDGRTIATLEDETIRIRDGDLLGIRAELPQYPRAPVGIDLDAAGKRAAIRTRDALEVWELDPPLLVRRIEATCAEFAGVAISPDGTRVATSVARDPEILASLDRGDILLAEVDGLAAVRLPGSDGEVCSLAFSPDGSRLACGGWTGRIVVRDGSSGEPLVRLTGHTQRVFSLAFSPDGTRLASGSDDTSIRIWDPERPGELALLGGHDDYVFALAFSPDGSCLASGSGDGTVRLWDTRPERERILARSRARTAREAARPAVEALLAERGDAAAVLRALAAEPPAPARTAAIEALIERALASPPR